MKNHRETWTIFFKSIGQEKVSKNFNSSGAEKQKLTPGHLADARILTNSRVTG